MDPLSVRNPCFPPLLIPVPGDAGTAGQVWDAAGGGRALGSLIQGLEEKGKRLGRVEQDQTVPRRKDAVLSRRPSESVWWKGNILRSC